MIYFLLTSIGTIIMVLFPQIPFSDKGILTGIILMHVIMLLSMMKDEKEWKARVGWTLNIGLSFVAFFLLWLEVNYPNLFS